MKLFDPNLAQKCEYCEYSKKSYDNLLCSKKGITISKNDSCKLYEYNPIKRIPFQKPRLPQFSPEDFDIDSI